MPLVSVMNWKRFLRALILFMARSDIVEVTFKYQMQYLRQNHTYNSNFWNQNGDNTYRL